MSKLLLLNAVFLDTTVIHHPQLSLEAKGLYSVICSLAPHAQHFDREELKSYVPDEAELEKLLKELSSFGIISLEGGF